MTDLYLQSGYNLNDDSSYRCVAKIPAFILGIVIGFWFCKKFYLKSRDSIVNRDINKSAKKIVDSVDTNDIEDQKSFCRCWRSKNFPYCDGSHVIHNEMTGDNVGPLIIHKVE
ncbi:unnamed protein product [Soboliphyme baturini]|uniref:ZnF_CDGSH domain-containing protein n=1 Tax=Soboliphyme baturini TaxID=241478 RepID=A0A183IR95_9BILA|nr:unnamed protein product [Soboliphyme baturini]